MELADPIVDNVGAQRPPSPNMNTGSLRDKGIQNTETGLQYKQIKITYHGYWKIVKESTKVILQTNSRSITRSIAVLSDSSLF